jgi:PhoH-like ATPase
LDSATIRIELNGIRTDKLTQYGLKAEKADNRILAAVLGLADKNPVTRFVSVDVNMRLKAAALGLHAEDWTHRTKRPAHEAGWCELEATPDVIDALFKSGETPAPDDCTAQDNEFVVLHHGSQSALTRRNGDMLRRLTKSPRAWGLAPRSKEQMFALDLLLDPEVPVVSLAGPAGTGKTILALAAALEQTFEPSMRRYDRLMILRPVIAVGRQELGFLPGDVEQKLGPWFEAVIDAMVALGDKVSHADARRTLDMWTGQGSLTMEAVTFLRGRSLQRTFVLVDEAQNLEAPLTLKTILTRVGEGSKVVFLGDTTQIDNPYAGAESNALAVLESRFAGSSLFGHVTLTKGERSKVADLAAQVL